RSNLSRLFSVCLSLPCSLGLLVFSAQAHEDNVAECRCERPGHEHHEEHHGGRHQQAFEEGSPNVYTASTVPQDHLYLMYSHNFFWTTLPRSSNPAFWMKYAPLEHLQLDLLTTLRSPFELEGAVSYQVFDERKGDVLSLTPRLSFNTRGNVVGGEVSASRFI